MRSIFGEEIGTVVSFARQEYSVRHPWPEETSVSAGRGVVFVRGGENYRTLFMEVYPPGASFIRGEGPTREACEDSCWEQYQRALHCVEGHEHEWTPHRVSKDGSLGHRYRNGAGFCLHCRAFRSKAFTGEQLGQFCTTCGVGTLWHQSDDGDWLCQEHAPVQPDLTMEEMLEMLEDG